MARTSVEIIVKRRERFRKRPGTGRTHALSTSLTRFMAVDGLTRRVFGRCLIRKKSSGIRALRKSLGRLRDAQELRLKVKPLPDRDAATRRFLKHLTRERSKRLKEFQAELADFRMKSITRYRKRGSIKRLLKGVPERNLPELRRELLDRVMALVPPAVDGQDDHALHRLRVRYKVYRYTIDLLPSEMTGADDAFRADLKHYQTVLGEAHDWLVMKQAWQAFQTSIGESLPEPAWLSEAFQSTHNQARAVIVKAIERLDNWEKQSAKGAHAPTDPEAAETIVEGIRS